MFAFVTCVRSSGLILVLHVLPGDVVVAGPPRCDYLHNPSHDLACLRHNGIMWCPAPEPSPHTCTTHLYHIQSSSAASVHHAVHHLPPRNARIDPQTRGTVIPHLLVPLLTLPCHQQTGSKANSDMSEAIFTLWLHEHETHAQRLKDIESIAVQVGITTEQLAGVSRAT
jgi:hypothetical protein